MREEGGVLFSGEGVGRVRQAGVVPVSPRALPGGGVATAAREQGRWSTAQCGTFPSCHSPGLARWAALHPGRAPAARLMRRMEGEREQ